MHPSSAAFASGRYAVQRLLDEGSKKRVYLAHDTRLDRDVALAVIRIERFAGTGRERELREAQGLFLEMGAPLRAEQVAGDRRMGCPACAEQMARQLTWPGNRRSG